MTAQSDTMHREKIVYLAMMSVKAAQVVESALSANKYNLQKLYNLHTVHVQSDSSFRFSRWLA